MPAKRQRSREKEHYMSDEEIIETEQTTEIEETPAPQLTDEQVAAYLGVDPAFLSESKDKISNIGQLYSLANKRNMEAMAKLKEAEAKATTPAPATPETDDDEDMELDEKSQRALDKWFQKKYGFMVSTVQQQKAEAMSEVIDDFGDKNPDADHLRINALMDELGLWDVSDTPAKLKKNLERAKKIADAEKFDPEAEAERIAAERLKSKVKDGEEVVEVKKKAGSVPKARSEAEILADPSIPWFEKEKLLSQTK